WAVENRVAFVRADPNGQSFVLDPQGRFVAETPMYRNEVLVASVVLGDGQGTLYTKFGDWFAYLCVAVALGLAVSGKQKDVRSISDASEMDRTREASDL